MLLLTAALAVSFAPTRLPINVYIEDTDAYSVVFYANCKLSLCILLVWRH